MKLTTHNSQLTTQNPSSGNGVAAYSSRGICLGF